MVQRASVLLIGNELLTGKIQDENLAFLAKELFALGITLDRARVVRDHVPSIAADLRELTTESDVVFTTGGVGPTHDDVTIEALSVFANRPLVRSSAIEELLARYFGAELGEAHLRLARIPEGAELLNGPEAAWPVLRVDRVYAFPGVPAAVRRSWPLVRERIRGERSFVGAAIFLSLDEFAIAKALDEVSGAFPAVAIGSYPRWGDPSYRTKVTFDGAERAEVDRALEAFRERIDPAGVVRVE
jgi:molybdenum cofactor synthesis domain-containing protein